MVYLLQQQQKETQPKLSCQNLPKREKIEKKPSSGGKGGFECEICKVKFMKVKSLEKKLFFLTILLFFIIKIFAVLEQEQDH